MDRQLVYPGQIPLETDLLNTNKYAMVGLSKLIAALFGSTTLVNGFTCIPTGPATLQVQVTAGEIYSLQNIDGTAYSSLAADTTHQIVKQGILLDTVTLSAPAPGTGGQSINYLVQVTYQDVDGTPVVLPYYNASNPAVAYSGPNNAGTTNNTIRKGVATVAIKAGVAATTGTQSTPAPDAGYTGMFVVTVANGQTQILAGNISQLAGAPFAPSNALIAGGFQGNYFNIATAGGTADALTGAFTPVISALTNGMSLYIRATSANATTTPTFTPNNGTITAKIIVKGNGLPLAAGDIAGGGHWIELQYDLTLDRWVLLNPATGITTAIGIQGTFKNLKIDAIGINNYNCVINADEVSLENGSNSYYTARSINKTINANATVGAPLSIMSARAASTWYYRWLWYNATSGLTATLDTSSTAPTAPTGYVSTDYKALLPGACRTDSSGNTYLLQISTRNQKNQYVVLAGSNVAGLPIMVSGAQGSPSTPTWVSVAVANFVPPTANVIRLMLSALGSTASLVLAAPNNSYGAYGSATNPPPLMTYNPSGSTEPNILGDFLLESTNVYFAAVNGGLLCFGWE